MSYCRWSSDDFQSDIYCYPSVDGGIRTHVASNKYVFPVSLPEPVGIEDAEAWVARYVKVSAILKDAAVVRIGLPSDGKDFTDDDQGAAAERLIALRAEGYRVPQRAIDRLLSEHETSKGVESALDKRPTAPPIP